MIADKSILAWIGLFYMSHWMTPVGVFQWCWPNGKAGLKQDQREIEVYTVINAEIQKSLSDGKK